MNDTTMGIPIRSLTGPILTGRSDPRVRETLFRSLVSPGESNLGSFIGTSLVQHRCVCVIFISLLPFYCSHRVGGRWRLTLDSMGEGRTPDVKECVLLESPKRLNTIRF